MACLICLSSPIIKADGIILSTLITILSNEVIKGVKYSLMTFVTFIIFSLGEGILANDENSSTK